MFFLGVFDGTHDAGAVLLKDGQPIFASNEERYTGVKEGRRLASKKHFRRLKSTAKQCTMHAFAGSVNPNPVLRLWRKQQKKWKLDDGKYFSKEDTVKLDSPAGFSINPPFPYMRSEDRVTQSYIPFIRRSLTKELQRKHQLTPHQISIEDHHHCHAAAGHFTSGWPNALVIVADGVGDGIAFSIWMAQKECLTLLRAIPYPHSLGLFFASVTGHLGYRPFRHEGKLVGLAARGKASRIPFAFQEWAMPSRDSSASCWVSHSKSWLKRSKPCARRCGRLVTRGA